ncbi:MAG TPA: hypothetical protein VFF24_14785 [Acidimicrobiia bacterium]|nr:hypothetical protein [Acidimicrobiia bacterium]
MVLAESLFGWYLGLTVAFTLIVVVVAVVASILTLAQRITEQAPLAADGLRAVAANTSHLDALMVTNDAVAELKEEALRHAALVEAL